MTFGKISAAALFLGILGAAPARAQIGMTGGGRPLGGYGASTIGSYYGNGAGYTPYNGRSAVVPSPAGPSIAPVPRRMPSTPIGGASSGSSSRAVMGADPRSGRRTPGPGMGMGPGSGASVGMPMTAPGRARRGPSGPGLGWPFSVPAGLTGSASTMP